MIRFRLSMVCIIALIGMWVVSCQAQVRPLPPSPLQERAARQGVVVSKARELFRLAQGENPRLAWNECMAGKAYERARWMARTGDFSHRDRKTGRNPAWDMIKSCLDCRALGENLTRGDESAAVLHETLMKSPGHRGNILDPKFRHLGVGCYRDICVQLFAG